MSELLMRVSSARRRRPASGEDSARGEARSSGEGLTRVWTPGSPGEPDGETMRWGRRGWAGSGVGALDDDALTSLLARSRHVGDPLADALVEVFAELRGGEGWELFERAIEHGLDAVRDGPQELRVLIESASTPPSWFELDLVDAGALSFWRAGVPASALALIYGSLAFGYQYGDLARPLAATGRLQQMASRRLAETTRWVLAVTTPGAMAPWAPGWASSVRVRVVHALIRRKLLASERWDREAWGVPISASAMMATAIGGFNVVPSRALADMGVRCSAADRETRTALWRWVGYVMGVPEQLLPASWAESERLIETLASLDHGRNDDGAALMHALTHNTLILEGLLPPWLLSPARHSLAPLLEAFVRRWLGEEASEQLGVSDTRLVRLVPALRPPMRMLSMLLSSELVGERRSARTQIAVVERLLDAAKAPRGTLSPTRAG